MTTIPAESSVSATQTPAGTGQTSARMRPVASAPADARRLIRQVGSRWALPPSLVENAALVAGALVLESVRQARSPLRLTATRIASAVVIQVEDSCVSFPHACERAALGLEVVGRVAAAYGFVRRPAGRQLWARLDVADTAVGVGEGGNVDCARVVGAHVGGATSLGPEAVLVVG